MIDTRLIFTITNPRLEMIANNLYRCRNLPNEYSFWRWRSMKGVRQFFADRQFTEPRYETFRPEFIGAPRPDLTWLIMSGAQIQFWQGDVAVCPFHDRSVGDLYLPKGWVSRLIDLRCNPCIVAYDEDGRVVTSNGYVGIYVPPAPKVPDPVHWS